VLMPRCDVTVGKLMEMLSDENNKDAITWLPHGKSFIIYRKKSFSEEVLPKYFKACKYTSFTRKVSRTKRLQEIALPNFQLTKAVVSLLVALVEPLGIHSSHART
jgi:HSF-type DNA-binding